MLKNYQGWTTTTTANTNYRFALQRCRKNQLLRKSEISLIRYDGHLWSIWLQYGLSKSSVKPMKYWTFRSGGLQMASHKLLTLADGWMKNDQLCISKNQKLQREAQFGQVKNAFEATHSDSRAKIVTFCLLTNSWKSLKMHCNLPSKWIMRSPKKQAWCRGVSKWECKNTYKTCDILHICSKCQEN